MCAEGSIKVGGRYGRLTVVREDGRDRHGHRMYEYLCDCGNSGHAQAGFLRGRDNIRCKKCAAREIGHMKRIEIVGQVINGWEVVEQAGTNKHGADLFRCRCVDCGDERIKTSSSIRRPIKYKVCACPLNYSFAYVGDYAVVTLPDGSDFKVDKSLVPTVKLIRWHKNEKGYIISKGHKQKTIYLHRLVLGLGDSDIVDHVNRDKTDCRKANLRVCSFQQNAANRGMQCNNTSGHAGVSWVPSRHVYYSRIGFNNKCITLGVFRDPERAAQVRNIAAEYFFGGFMGHRNVVPEPPPDLVQAITKKCAQYA